MFKLGLFLSLAAICGFSSVQGLGCTLDVNTIFGNINGNINIPVSDMSNDCTTATEKQIKMEITASLNYLNMAAFFSKDTINRPGFAKFFFDAASEEREHAYKLIEYLSMRNRYEKTAYLNTIGIKKLVADLGKITETRTVLKDADGVDVKLDGLVAQEATPGQKAEAGREATVAIDGKTTGLIALKNALKLENAVTKNIRGLIVTCERGVNDYHFVDYLTGEFLEEQYKGQRDLAGKIATLGKMVKDSGAELADFLFDKQLL